MDLPSRIVVKDSEFEEQLLALVGNMELADDFTAAAEELLAREPDCGIPASRDGSVWMLPMSPIGSRRVSLYYSFDSVAVTFHSIMAFDD